MVTVKTRKELSTAVKNGESDIHVANKRLFQACKIVAKRKKHSFEPKGAGIFSEPTIIALSLIGAATIIALYAIFKGRRVVITHTGQDGTGQIQVI